MAYTRYKRAMKKLAGTNPTPRETEVWKLTAEGLTVRKIASRLRVKPSRVKSQKDRLMYRLGAHSKVELAVRWVKRKA